MTIDQIIDNIWNQQDQILSNLNPEDIAVYVFLKNEYSKGDILNNFVFQYVFKSWWGINNASWSNEMKKRYFELLSDGQTDLKIILTKLYAINETIQFVFATKLLHTIDNNHPIFDSRVGKIFGKSVQTQGNKDSRINSCIEIQNYLNEKYIELKVDKKIKQVIDKFRLKFIEIGSEEISEVKILDFLIWSLAGLN